MKNITKSTGACGLTVYSKQGVDCSFGVEKTSTSSFDLYIIGRRGNPIFLSTVKNKNGDEITDDVIENHIQKLYNQKYIKMTVGLTKRLYNAIRSWIDDEHGWDGESEEDRAIRAELTQWGNELLQKLQMAELKESLKKDTRAMNRIKKN